MRLLLAALPLLAASPLNAQDLTLPEADLLPRIIDFLCVDMVDETNGCEQIYLVASTEEVDTADLVILTDRRTDPGGAPLLIVRQVAFNGAMWGMAPSLEETEDGALRLHSEQTGIGRHPWMQSLEIGYRNDAFLVTGFHYTTYDRISAAGFTCDFDMDGGYVRTEMRTIDPETERETEIVQGYNVTPTTPPLDLWDAFQSMPDPCSDGLSEFFDMEF